MAWVGKDLKNQLVPIHCCEQGCQPLNQIRAPHQGPGLLALLCHWLLVWPWVNHRRMSLKRDLGTSRGMGHLTHGSDNPGTSAPSRSRPAMPLTTRTEALGMWGTSSIPCPAGREERGLRANVSSFWKALQTTGCFPYLHLKMFHFSETNSRLPQCCNTYSALPLHYWC